MRYFGTDGLTDLSSSLILSGTAEKTGRLPAFAGRTVVVGRDVRVSSSELEKQILRGLISVGADVYVTGIVTPAALSLAAKKLDASAAVMLTGGGLPPEFGGIRILGKNGRYLTCSETKALNDALLREENVFDGVAGADNARVPNNISEEAASDVVGDGEFYTGRRASRVKIYDGAEFQYKRHIVSGFPRFDGIRLRLAVSYGCLSGLAADIFESLGAVITVVENDARNGEIVNITDSAACVSDFVKRVRKDETGFVFDGDGSRVLAVVDGKLYDGDAILLAISTLYRLRGKLSKRFVVGTKYSNSRLARELAWHGTALIRTDEGAGNIYETMRRENCVLGGEKNGGVIIADKTPVCDGMVTALTLLEAKKIMGDLPKYSPYPMREFNVKSCEKQLETVYDFTQENSPENKGDENRPARLSRPDSWKQKLPAIEKLVGTKGRLLIGGTQTDNPGILSVECFSKNYAEIFNSIQKSINE